MNRIIQLVADKCHTRRSRIVCLAVLALTVFPVAMALAYAKWAWESELATNIRSDIKQFANLFREGSE